MFACVHFVCCRARPHNTDTQRWRVYICTYIHRDKSVCAYNEKCICNDILWSAAPDCHYFKHLQYRHTNIYTRICTCLYVRMNFHFAFPLRLIRQFVLLLYNTPKHFTFIAPNSNNFCGHTQKTLLVLVVV